MSRNYDSISKSLVSIKGAILRTFDNAAKFHWPHEKLLEWRNASFGVYGRPDYPTLPRWAKAEIDGFWGALNALMWRDKLVFTYRYKGMRYALNTPEYRAIPVREIELDTGAYAWKDDINCLFTMEGSGLKKKREPTP